MKNQLLLILSLLPLGTYLSAQTTPCMSQAVGQIAANRAKANLGLAGDLFTYLEAPGGFMAPYHPGREEIPTIFLSALWLSARDTADNLKVSAAYYRGGANDNYKFDFWPGPLNENTGEVFPGACQQFDRFWGVRRYDILRLREDFAPDGAVDDPVAEDLLRWPGRGNPHFAGLHGFELPDQDLAPFFDENGDGLYNPLDGDYPVLDPAYPEVLPEEMRWGVFNDRQDFHSVSGGDPLGVEVQMLVYAFQCEDDPLLNRTVFSRHRILNRSGEPLHQLRVGMFTDFDLGCETDDYLGCDTLTQTIYAYNRYPIDGSSSSYCAAVEDPGFYDLDPAPVQTKTFLSHAPASIITIFNFPNFGVPTGIERPQEAEQFDRYLNGRWKFGQPLTVGGTGLNPDTNFALTNYAFFDPPGDSTGWSMYTTPLFRAPLGPVGAIRQDSFPAGDAFVLDLAYTFHWDSLAGHLAQVDRALEAIPELHSLYQSDFALLCQQPLLCDTACVWPGDADNDGRVRPHDLLPVGLAAAQPAAGPERPHANFLWQPQASADWPTAGPGGVNHKYADGDGDGLVTPLDAALSILNLGEYQPGAPPEPMVPAPVTSPEIYLTDFRDTVDTEDFLSLRLVMPWIYLGADEQPVSDIYGIAFTIRYDASLLHKSNFNWIIPPDSTFFGDTNETIHLLAVDTLRHRVDVAVCRTDGQNVSGHGRLGRFTLTLRKDARTPNPNGTEKIFFELYNVRAVNAAGELLEIGARSDTAVAVNLTYDPTLSTGNSPATRQLRLFPNPTRGELNVELPAGWRGAFQLELFDATGRRVWSREEWVAGPVLTTNLPEGLPEGLYFVKLRGGEGKTATGKLFHW